jgi:hypothetical protein
MSGIRILSDDNDINNVAKIEIDYNGNVYLLYNGIYYIVLLDSENINGVELVKINNNKYYYDMFNENEHLFQNACIGNILSGKETLSGKIYEHLNNMSSEEKRDYTLKNNYDLTDPKFIERTYYRVQYNDSDEDENMPFRLSGIDLKNEQKGLTLSRLLTPYPCSFDTIYIDGDIISKNVLSSSERIDGYCSSRLTLYSSGYIRCNFIDKVILSRLCIDNRELNVKLNNSDN